MQITRRQGVRLASSATLHPALHQESSAELSCDAFVVIHNQIDFSFDHQFAPFKRKKGRPEATCPISTSASTRSREDAPIHEAGLTVDQEIDHSNFGICEFLSILAIGPSPFSTVNPFNSTLIYQANACHIRPLS